MNNIKLSHRKALDAIESAIEMYRSEDETDVGTLENIAFILREFGLDELRLIEANVKYWLNKYDAYDKAELFQHIKDK